MKQRRDKAKAEATRENTEEDYLLEVEEIEQEKADIESNIKEYSAELETIDAQRAELQTELDLIKKEMETVEAEKKKALPTTRYTLSLYANITNIDWEYSDRTHVKGKIILKDDVRPFNLDPSKHSQFVITNYLWDLMA